MTIATRALHLALSSFCGALAVLYAGTGEPGLGLAVAVVSVVSYRAAVRGL